MGWGLCMAERHLHWFGETACHDCERREDALREAEAQRQQAEQRATDWAQHWARASYDLNVERERAEAAEVQLKECETALNLALESRRSWEKEVNEYWRPTVTAAERKVDEAEKKFEAGREENLTYCHALEGAFSALLDPDRPASDLSEREKKAADIIAGALTAFRADCPHREKVDEYRQQAEAHHTALRKWGHHTPKCTKWPPEFTLRPVAVNDRACTCGLEDALRVEQPRRSGIRELGGWPVAESEQPRPRLTVEQGYEQFEEWLRTHTHHHYPVREAFKAGYNAAAIGVAEPERVEQPRECPHGCKAGGCAMCSAMGCPACHGPDWRKWQRVAEPERER